MYTNNKVKTNKTKEESKPKLFYKIQQNESHKLTKIHLFILQLPYHRRMTLAQHQQLLLDRVIVSGSRCGCGDDGLLRRGRGRLLLLRCLFPLTETCKNFHSTATSTFQRATSASSATTCAICRRLRLMSWCAIVCLRIAHTFGVSRCA